MAGLNKVMIIGNLGKDPELRYTQRGTAVCQFTVAVNRPGRVGDDGQRSQDETEWFRVVAWDKLGETCSQYLTKGRQVYVEGRLQTRKWEGQDGQKRYSTEVVASQMTMLGPNPGANGDGNGRGSYVPDDYDFPDDDAAPTGSGVRSLDPADLPF